MSGNNPSGTGCEFAIAEPHKSRRYVDASGRSAYNAAAWLGAIASLATFLLYAPVCKEFEPIVNFYLGMEIAPAMLGRTSEACP